MNITPLGVKLVVPEALVVIRHVVAKLIDRPSSHRPEHIEQIGIIAEEACGAHPQPALRTRPIERRDVVVFIAIRPRAAHIPLNPMMPSYAHPRTPLLHGCGGSSAVSLHGLNPNGYG